MDPFIGEIRLFGFDFAPKGWAVCQGQLMRIQQNTALFSLLGTQYGGDGKQTFALPNLQGAAPLGQGTWCIAIQGIFPSRD
jgi:microcystin-dependent protein